MANKVVQGPFQSRSEAESVSVDEVVKIVGEEPSIFKQTSAGLDWFGNQESGPHIRASGWHDPEPVGDQLYISGLLRFSDIVGHSDSDPQDTATKSQNMEPGTRLLFTQNSFSYLSANDAFADDNPNDRTWACDLNENISGASRTSITVTSLPYSLSDGEKIWIQTGDPSSPPLTDSDVIPCYVDGSVAQGDTSIPIDDGNGNPVTITASSGDRILTDHQSPWLDHATAEMKSEWQSWLDTFQANGGIADGVVMDSEGVGISPNTYIKNDPRWDDDSEGINGTSLKTLNANADSWGQEVMGVRFANAWETAIYEPLDARFPGATCSQYNWTGMTKEEAGNGPNQDGKKIYQPAVGTHGSFPQYAAIRNAVNVSSNPDSHPGNYSLHDSPFETVQYEVERVRAAWRSNSGKIQPWITYQSLSDSFYQVDVRGAGTPLYWEYLYHMIMSMGDADVPILYFNPNPATKENSEDLGMAEDTAVDLALREVNGKARGTSWSLHTTGKIDWRGYALTTGIKVGNKIVWRITVRRVDPQDDRDVVVNVDNGDSITISGGGGRGSSGTWYESSVGENPIFTVDHPPVENLYPSEDFQGIADGNWTFVKDTDPSKVSITDGYSDPLGGNRGIEVDFGGTNFHINGPLFSVEPNTKYTFSFWHKSKVEAARFIDQDGNRLFKVNPDNNDNTTWNRTRVVFSTPSDVTQARFTFDKGQPFGQWKMALPMLNKGENIAQYQSP